MLFSVLFSMLCAACGAAFCAVLCACLCGRVACAASQPPGLACAWQRRATASAACTQPQACCLPSWRPQTAWLHARRRHEAVRAPAVCEIRCFCLPPAVMTQNTTHQHHHGPLQTLEGRLSHILRCRCIAALQSATCYGRGRLRAAAWKQHACAIAWCRRAAALPLRRCLCACARHACTSGCGYLHPPSLARQPLSLLPTCFACDCTAMPYYDWLH